jgi:hypothetical protein
MIRIPATAVLPSQQAPFTPPLPRLRSQSLIASRYPGANCKVPSAALTRIPWSAIRLLSARWCDCRSPFRRFWYNPAARRVGHRPGIQRGGHGSSRRIRTARGQLPDCQCEVLRDTGHWVAARACFYGARYCRGRSGLHGERGARATVPEGLSRSVPASALKPWIPADRNP